MKNACALILFFAASLSVSSPAFADGPAAMVVYVQGTVHVQKEAGTEQIAALGTEIQESDTLITDDASQVRVRLFDRSLLRIGPNSRAQMAQLKVDAQAEHKEVSIKLFAGRLWASVSKLLTPDSRFEVQAANAVAGVRGTKLEAGVDGNNKGWFSCLEGKVQVDSGDQHQTLIGGTEVSFDGKFGQVHHLTLRDIILRNDFGHHGGANQLGEKFAEQKADHLIQVLGGAGQHFDRYDSGHVRDIEDARQREDAADNHNRGAPFVEYNEAVRLGIPLDRTRIEGTVTVH